MIVHDYMLTGLRRIDNKLDTCTCGCRGRDPQHKLSYKRVVRDVRRLDAAERVTTRDGRSIRIIARGTAAHPAEDQPQPIGLQVMWLWDPESLGIDPDDRDVVLDWAYLRQED